MRRSSAELDFDLIRRDDSQPLARDIAMRFLHTADWHLGRLFHQEHLTEDQAFVLQQVIDIARGARLDAVVIAGDVYDRAVPPPDAVRLLDDTLFDLLLGLRVPVILAAGNHDSPERLSFGARLLANQRLHLFGFPSAAADPVVLRDDHGPVAFHVVPYAEPALARQRLGDETITDHETAMRAVIASRENAGPGLQLGAPLEIGGDRASLPARPRSVFVGHAFVQGALTCDSERPLSVGGAGAVAARNFDPFHYVALGHLHRPQHVGDERLRYAGAILKYSFDEVGQQRSVTIVEMDDVGACRAEEVALVPRREVRCIEGTLEDLLHEGIENRGGAVAKDYVAARLTDRHPVLDPIGRLRAVYPHVLTVERVRQDVPGEERRLTGDRRRLDFGELFTAFFKDVTGQQPRPDEEAVFASSANEVARQGREVVT